MAARKDRFGCPGELSWLARGVELKQFRTCLTYAYSFSLLPTPPPKRKYNAVFIVADEVWQYHTGGNLTIFDKDHDAMEDRSRTAEVLAAKCRRSLQLPCTAGGNQAKLNVYRIRNLRKGGAEAGHAHGCRSGRQTPCETRQY